MQSTLLNKTYVVTGATSGIGLATTEALARAGANVIGVGRSAERCQSTRTHLQKINPISNILYFCADLSSQADIHHLVDNIQEALAKENKESLDGLINIAGAFTYWMTLTGDGVETQWAVNHLAPFLLTHRLLPLLLKAQNSRIITVSSDSHYSGRIDWNDPQLRRHYNGLQAYNNTKLANVLFTLELSRRLASHPDTRAYAVDPGLVKTDIGMKGTPALVAWIWKIRRSGGTGPEVPARCILHLLSAATLQYSNELYWKNCRPKPAGRQALNVESAKRLWDLSEKMVGLDGGVL